MRILLSIRHPSYLRNLLEVVRRLAGQGHRLHFVFDAHGPLGEDSLFEELCRSHPTITGQFIEKRDPSARVSWREQAERLRFGIDYLRYLDPRYAEADALRERARDRAPAWAVGLGERLLSRSPLALRTALSLGAALEWSLPVRPIVSRFFELFRPDLVVVSPLVGLGTDQVDWIKEAKLRGLPSVLAVASWDNLTNKGRLRVLPERILVWNEAQKAEAVELHGAPAGMVTVCGAWSYDHWFDWRPSLDRDALLALVGLAPCPGYLLYVGSSPFIGQNEAAFCLELIRALRAEPATRALGVLIRPHPQNAAQWESLDLAGLGNVAIFPRSGANPIDRDRRNQYFDSLWHSDAVFGINTSAQIEAGILGRPVLTVTDPRYRATQTGTLHFHHLTSINGGLLHVAGSVEELARRLGALLALPAAERGEKSRRFVAGFIRPPELAEVPSDRAARAIVEAAALRPRRPRLDRWLGLLYRRLVLSRRTSFELTPKLRKALGELRLAGDEGNRAAGS
ncbi:hypothetical protein SAMN06265365_107195 [Tistlia consotensis]|uniref:Uncharacterized protein n=1 Tax=Tistlia consotensis USBA 355 TaxID=560819 RepID=A0A1Y6B8P8_9PROT|nr:hypothetical protein [Tistlia consotensis]SME98706.1 hypothetical protein SAMN05428998_102197 [Tistlia consotensis USBA 355]SNR58084.1 hypothetical protein SAMN06265365_107195 [Tistlia consotensis]